MARGVVGRVPLNFSVCVFNQPNVSATDCPLRRLAPAGSRQTASQVHTPCCIQHSAFDGYNAYTFWTYLQGRARQLLAPDSTGSQVLALQQIQVECTFKVTPQDTM